MKTHDKIRLHAFTLVELIVVITILAILGTLAFISLSGYNTDSKNAKVASDLRNMASAIEVSRTKRSIPLFTLVANSGNTNTVASSNPLNNSGSTLSSSGVNYLVGNLNFSQINQNGEAFKDPNSFDGRQEYIYGSANSPEFAYYQLAGQIIENDIKKTRVIGTYTQIDTVNDVAGLLSTRENDTAIVDGGVITGDLYQ